MLNRLKRALVLLGLAFGLVKSTFAAGNIITATVTVTNTAGTTNGQTITVNGVTRTWAATVTTPASQIATNNTMNGAATNLFAQVANNPISGVAAVSFPSTNVVTFSGAPGAALTASLSAGWGTVGMGTQLLTSAIALRLPLTVETASQQTNLASLLSQALELSPRPISDFLTVLSNYVSLGSTQTVSGPKTFSSANNNFTAGAITTFGLTVTDLSSTATLTLAANTNVGGKVWTIQSIPSGVVIPEGLYLGGNLTIGQWSIQGLNANMSSNGFSGDISACTNFNGSGIQAGTVAWSAMATNPVLRGTTTLGTGSDISFGRFALSSLASGNNAAVAVGTNTFIEVSGPGSAFTINGINANPNRDGKLVIVLNRTGFNMTIAHDSGVDPTAANRIYCLTAADKTVTGNSAAVLIYSGTASRWICLSFTQ